MPDQNAVQEVRNSVRKLLSKELVPQVERLEESGTFGIEAFRKLGQAGLAAPMLPEPYGMHDLLLQTVVAEEMGYVSSGFGLSALASVCLFGANVGRRGSEEQKKKYLPGIASGEKIGCWGLTEPGVGSDATSIQTRCERKGDHYILNGTKTFITNAPIADYFVVLAREVSPDGKLREGFDSATAFILERGPNSEKEGLRTGKPFKKLGHLSSPTGEIFMENLKVPVSQVMGQPGRAFYDMKVSLDVERAVFAGLGIGLQQFCLEAVVKYGAQRKQFGVSILEHQLVQEKVAEIAATLDVGRTYLYTVLEKLQRGEGANKEAAILKFLFSRFSMRAADDAVQCLGGYGYMREYQVERCLRDAKLYEIGGGTTEIQKMIVAKQVIKEILASAR